MRAILSIVLLVTLCSGTSGHDPDQTLRFYLRTATTVVAGTLESIEIGAATEEGVHPYHCTLSGTELLKGKGFNEKTMRVTVVQFQQGVGDMSPALKKGTKCILFLKPHPNDPKYLETVDPWFGIQPYNSVMAESLARLVKEEEEKKKEAKPPNR